MTIYLGDCVKVMSDMVDDYTIDLIVTSPPYGTLRDYNGYCFDFEKTSREMYRVLKKGGVAVWVVGDTTKNGDKSLVPFEQGLMFKRIGFRMFDVMIYEKNGVAFPRKNGYTNGYEFMFVLSKDAPPRVFNALKRPNRWAGTTANTTDRQRDGTTVKKGVKIIQAESNRSNVWKYNTGYMKSTPDKIAYGHPATFPERLAEDHILSWSNPGDTVLDPFCGSGTTLKMAARHGRKYIGIDISPEYIEIARQRTAQESLV